jgi:2-C-methyl-D-erythritol 2,4-cyclodiphosphate synthase
MSTDFRIGQGYDVHALTPGRKLILGGVEIPFDRGLLGHSDADALLHAITDALLGRGGPGRHRRHVSRYQRRSGKAPTAAQLLRGAMAAVREAGWRVGNVDATIIAQAPRIAPHVAAMRANIAADLGIDPGAVNVKGKTNERLGFEGRGEGIATQAVVLLQRDEPLRLKNPRSHRVFFALWPDAESASHLAALGHALASPGSRAMRPAIRCT